ncbi:MAG: hypothetical protein D6681_14180, partial [Calditrichaeota bacterium]
SRWIGALMVLLLLGMAASAGTVKKTQSEVKFTKIGKYRVNATEYLTTDQKRVDEETKFKGEGFLKNMAVKLIFKSGKQGQIIQLPASQIVQLDHKKKTYRIQPIKPVAMKDSGPGEGEMEEGEEEAPAEQGESEVEIVRMEFTVTPFDEEKTINGFPCRKYGVLWLTEWRNKTTDEHGTDSLYTTVWTTPYTEEIREAVETEKTFSSNYLKKLGIDVDAMQEAVLGMNWMQMLGKLNPEESAASPTNSPDIATELKKLEGYPIVIDGAYFAIRPKKAREMAEEEEEESGGLGFKKSLGGFLKKKMKKKKKPGLQPVFTYYTEVQELRTEAFSPDLFTIPSGYKEKQ